MQPYAPPTSPVFSFQHSTPFELLAESAVFCSFFLKYYIQIKMADNEIKVEEPNDFMTIDRNPVPLAYCAYPTKVATKNPKKENRVVDELLELVDPVIIANPTEVRQAASLKSFGCDTESEFEFSGDESDFDINDIKSGALNSDEEFDRLVKCSAKIIENTHKTEYSVEADGKKSRKAKTYQKTRNVHEYDYLPPLQNLSIECNSKLVQFGFVSKVVDCQVVIVPTCTEVLDFDSYIFDERGNSIGQVYDIFGQVKHPEYVIRFNSGEQASMIPINMKVYYAPNEEQFSKTPFKGLNLASANRDVIKSLNRQLDHQEAVAKAAVHINPVEIESDVEFSDDEAEREFRRGINSTRQVQTSRSVHNSNRGNRKRDRRVDQKVTFSTRNTDPQQYRNGAQQFSGPAPPARSPQVTSSNPYAEFGCHTGFNGRFGI